MLLTSCTSFNLLLFNFQGPFLSGDSLHWDFLLFVLSLTRDLYIISYLEALVKRFCESFSSFLSFFFRLPLSSLRSFKTIRSLLADFDIISYFLSFVKRFSKVFSLFSNPLGVTRLADSLFSIPHLRRFVKGFIRISLDL